MNGIAGVLEAYRGDAQAAYAEYARAVQLAGRADNGKMDPNAMISGAFREELQVAAGRLGAALGAAAKRASREVIFMALEDASRRGHDVTPTVASHTAKRLLSRGISNRAANARFGIRGRTASSKSEVRESDLADIESRARENLLEMKRQISQARDLCRQRWLDSPERAELFREWTVAQGGAGRRS